MKFKDMPYERINEEAVLSDLDVLTQRLTDAANADEALGVLRDYENRMSDVETMSSMSYIRHTVDTRDAFYEKESEFYDEFSPRCEEKNQQFLLAAYQSPLRGQLEGVLGDVLFKNIELQLKGFSPEIIPLMQEENKLSSEYEKLYASATVEMDGKTLPLTKLAPYKMSPNREIRHEAYRKEGEYFDSHREQYDSLFDKLVKNRTEQARKLGYENFVQLGYIRRGRNCYTASDVDIFRRQVVEVLVPIVNKIKEAQREKIGVDKLKFYDNTFYFPDGNPTPHGTPDELLEDAREMNTDMSPETAEFFKAMVDMDMFDLLAKEGKAPGGYCTSLPSYKMPFIFSNFNGTSDDVDVLTHEAGHAFADYVTSRQIPWACLRSPSMEGCETHSMSMEFLTSDYHHLFFKEDTKKYQLFHTEDALVFIPYGSMVDHFQEIVYSHPEYTPEQRNDEWAKLEKIYRPFMDFDDIPAYNRGAGWQRQLHIYLYPFYYIDYCMAQTAALQFYSLFLGNKKEAWDKYLAFVGMGGTKTFIDLVKSSGMLSPIEEGSLAKIFKNITDWLDAQEG